MNKTLIICGSNNTLSKSIFLSRFLSKSLSIWTIYLHSMESIPLINSNVSNRENLPKPIIFLSENIKKHDTLILIFPQYNYGFSAFFKNILDWLSICSRKIFLEKKIILIGVSNTQTGEYAFQEITKLTIQCLGSNHIKFIHYLTNKDPIDILNQLKNYV